MAFYLKIVWARSSCSPLAPHKDKQPKDCLQDDDREDTIVGKGPSGEIAGVELGPRRLAN